METIYIKKYVNGYTVELGWLGDDEEMYLFKTVEELNAELPSLIARAHQLNEEAKAKREAK